MSILPSPIIFMIAACLSNPWQDIYDREIAFRKSLIRGNADLKIPRVSSAAPVSHSPRIIIRKDSITFDNRAWWLSAPDVFFLDHHYLERRIGPCGRYECQKNLLIEEKILDLDNGYIKDEDWDEHLIPKLQEVLERQGEHHRTLQELYEYLEIQNGEVVDIYQPEKFDELLVSEKQITPEEKNTPTENVDWQQEWAKIKAQEKVERIEKGKAAIADRDRKRSREEIVEKGLHQFRLTGSIHLLVDEDVPYETVADVIFHVMQTEYHNCLLVGLKDDALVAVKTSAREWNELRFYNGYEEELVIQSNRCSLISNGDYYFIHCNEKYLYEPSKKPYFIKGETCKKSTDWRGLLDDFRSFQNSCFKKVERSPKYTVNIDDVDYKGIEPIINDAFVWYLIPSTNETFGNQISKIDHIENNFPQWAAFHYPLRIRSIRTDTQTEIQNCSNMIDISNLSNDERKLLCNLFFDVGKDIPEYQIVFPELYKLRMEKIQKNPIRGVHRERKNDVSGSEGSEMENAIKKNFEIFGTTGQTNVDNVQKEEQ